MGGYFTAGIEFTDIDVAGVSTRFFATLESAAPIPGFQMELETTSTIHGRTNRVVSERIHAARRRNLFHARRPLRSSEGLEDGLEDPSPEVASEQTAL
jgi:hypothetical protein